MKYKVGRLKLSWMDDTEDEMLWGDFMADLDQLLQKKNKDGYWYAEVKNFGWANQDGSKYFHSSEGLDFLQQVLPNTDCHFKIFNYGKGLAIQNYHHDSPTGNEWYYLMPITENTYERNR